MPADLVLASHRGPVSFTATEGGFQARRGSGGLVTGLLSAAHGARASWVAAALSDDDRAAVAVGAVDGALEGLDVRLLSLDPERHALALDRVCNETLWFATHLLWDTPREPSFGADWADAWAAYVELNEAFAEGLDAEAAPGAVVVVHDYHLCLVPSLLRARRPDLRIGFFLHTPWAPVEALRLLPAAQAEELLRGLLGADRIGFHTHRWAEAFAACCLDVLGESPGELAVHPLGVDADVLADSAADPAVAQRAAALRERLGDRRVVLRVDRMELSKNIVRGVRAFGELLQARPDLRGEVVHLVLAVPSRGTVEAYQRYAQDVRAEVARVNARWARPGWVPVVLDEADDFPRSLAALQTADVLVVTPVRDGMNLVAKEGCVLSLEGLALVLSREAGAAEEMAADALVVDPTDVAGTAAAIGAALDMTHEERAEHTRRLAAIATAHPPDRWLAAQVAAL